MAITIHAARMNDGIMLRNGEWEDRNGKKQTQEKKSLYTGDMMVQADRLALKKQLARKEAMKIIGDVFSVDRGLDDTMAGLEEQMKRLDDETLAYFKKLEDVETYRTQLEEGYQVERDSQECKDLELLRKEIDASYPWTGVELTDEEKESLAAIKEQGITGYQSEMLALDKQEEMYRMNIEKNRLSKEMASRSLSDYKLERLKENPMTKAKKQAEEIMEAAAKEIVGDLIDEGRQYQDEKLEKMQEQAQERAEQEEIKEKQEIKQKEKEAIQEALIEAEGDAKKRDILLDNAAGEPALNEEGLLESYDDKQDIQKKLKAILDQLKILEEDLKGMVVNTNM